MFPPYVNVVRNNSHDLVSSLDTKEPIYVEVGSRDGDAKFEICRLKYFANLNSRGPRAVDSMLALYIMSLHLSSLILALSAFCQNHAGDDADNGGLATDARCRGFLGSQNVNPKIYAKIDRGTRPDAACLRRTAGVFDLFLCSDRPNALLGLINGGDPPSH